MNPIILFRKGLEEEGEFDTCSSVFKTFEYRSMVPENSLVFGRYSVLPFYQELEKELACKKSKLINSYLQHQYIANIENWYEDVKEFTPDTWFSWADLPEQAYVIKGRTNSRKFRWKQRMFAPDKASISKIAASLMDDCLIADQGICVRKYIPLETYEIGINEMRFTNEWRCFFLGEDLIDYGYYWSNYEGPRQSDLDQEAFDFLRKVSTIVSKKTNFYVLDIAKTEEGKWILIEINDGQMSGLSCINPGKLYKNLWTTIQNKWKQN